MDWMFYLVAMAVMFGIAVVLLTIRALVNRRLEAREKKLREDREARQVAETNSGL